MHLVGSNVTVEPLSCFFDLQLLAKCLLIKKNRRSLHSCSKKVIHLQQVCSKGHFESRRRLCDHRFSPCVEFILASWETNHYQPPSTSSLGVVLLSHAVGWSYAPRNSQFTRTSTSLLVCVCHQIQI